MNQKCVIIIETTKTGYSAYAPEVPGVVATGDTKPEVEQNMKEALHFHMEGLEQEGFKNETNQYAKVLEYA